MVPGEASAGAILKAAFRLLAIIDEIDACFGLFPDQFAHRLADRGRKLCLVAGPSLFLCGDFVFQFRRSRQGSLVRGQNALAAPFHYCFAMFDAAMAPMHLLH